MKLFVIFLLNSVHVPKYIDFSATWFCLNSFTLVPQSQHFFSTLRRFINDRYIEYFFFFKLLYSFFKLHIQTLSCMLFSGELNSKYAQEFKYLNLILFCNM